MFLPSVRLLSPLLLIYCNKVAGVLLYAAGSQNIMDSVLRLLSKQLAETHETKIYTETLNYFLLASTSQHISMSDDGCSYDPVKLTTRHIEISLL